MIDRVYCAGAEQSVVNTDDQPMSAVELEESERSDREAMIVHTSPDECNTSQPVSAWPLVSSGVSSVDAAAPSLPTDVNFNCSSSSTYVLENDVMLSLRRPALFGQPASEVTDNTTNDLETVSVDYEVDRSDAVSTDDDVATQHHTVTATDEVPSHHDAILPADEAPSHQDAVLTTDEVPSHHDAVLVADEVLSHHDAILVADDVPSHHDVVLAADEVPSHHDAVLAAYEVPSHHDAVLMADEVSSRHDAVLMADEVLSNYDAVLVADEVPSRHEAVTAVDEVPVSHYYSVSINEVSTIRSDVVFTDNAHLNNHHYASSSDRFYVSSNSFHATVLAPVTALSSDDVCNHGDVVNADVIAASDYNAIVGTDGEVGPSSRLNDEVVSTKSGDKNVTVADVDSAAVALETNDVHIDDEDHQHDGRGLCPATDVFLPENIENLGAEMTSGTCEPQHTEVVLEDLAALVQSDADVSSKGLSLPQQLTSEVGPPADNSTTSMEPVGNQYKDCNVEMMDVVESQSDVITATEAVSQPDTATSASDAAVAIETVQQDGKYQVADTVESDTAHTADTGSPTGMVCLCLPSVD